MYNVKGKLSKYNKDWNNVKLFEDQVELNNFLEYSKQDSISLLQALLKAQKLYLNDYESSKDLLPIKSLIIRKYNGYNVYLHNFSNFDTVFLIKILSEL